MGIVTPNRLVYYTTTSWGTEVFYLITIYLLKTVDLTFNIISSYYYSEIEDGI